MLAAEDALHQVEAVCVGGVEGVLTAAVWAANAVVAAGDAPLFAGAGLFAAGEDVAFFFGVSLVAAAAFEGGEVGGAWGGLGRWREVLVPG